MKRKIIKAIALTIIICLSANVMAVNWNAIEVNDIEYYIQTNKSTYQLGETVEMLYRITNNGQNSITYTLGESPVWNFWAKMDDQCVWTGMYSKLGVVTTLTLGVGETVIFPKYDQPFTWNLKDNHGVPVQIGKYSIIGGIDHQQGNYDYTKVAVPIEIVPEPATLIVFGLGGLLLRKRS